MEYIGPLFLVPPPQKCYFSRNPANGIFNKSPWTTLLPSICKRIPNEIDNKHAGRQKDGRTNIPINRSKEQTHKALPPTPLHTPNQQKTIQQLVLFCFGYELNKIERTDGPGSQRKRIAQTVFSLQ